MNNSPGMKKLTFVFLVILILFGGGYFLYKQGVLAGIALDIFSKKEERAVEQPVEEQESVFEESVEPIYLPPSKISIKERNITAKVIEVGVAKDGSLDTPKNWNEAGWYEKGAKPGEKGNVIINAHFDDNYGRPAAFYQLKNATVGDTVLLEDSLGRLYAYQIVDSFLVDINDPERLKVLEESDDKSEMTLITCGGVWLPGVSTYDKRLVVKAELIETL